MTRRFIKQSTLFRNETEELTQGLQIGPAGTPAPAGIFEVYSDAGALALRINADGTSEGAALVDTDLALGTAAPQMDGTAAAGTGAAASHETHVHPRDTSRAPLASPAFTGGVKLPGYATGDPPALAVGDAGTLAYDTSTNKMALWTGAAWEAVTSA